MYGNGAVIGMKRITMGVQVAAIQAVQVQENTKCFVAEVGSVTRLAIAFLIATSVVHLPKTATSVFVWLGIRLKKRKKRKKEQLHWPKRA